MDCAEMGKVMVNKLFFDFFLYLLIVCMLLFWLDFFGWFLVGKRCFY